MVVKHVALLSVRRLQAQVVYLLTVNLAQVAKVEVTRHRPDRKQLILASATKLVGTIITSIRIEREEISVSIRKCGVCRHHVGLSIRERRHIGAHPVPIARKLLWNIGSKRHTTFLVITTLGIAIGLVMGRASLETGCHIDVVSHRLTEILIVVGLQTSRPTYTLRIVLAQLTAVWQGTIGKIGHGLAIFHSTQLTGMESFLSIPSFDVGILHIGREDGIQEEVVDRLIAQVECSGHCVRLLIGRTVVCLVQDIVVKPVFAVKTLIEAITTIGIVGRDGTAGIIGIVDEVDFTSCILTLVEITIDVDLELELLRQVEVNLSHRRITTVGRIVDDIVLVGITYRSIVSHQL